MRSRWIAPGRRALSTRAIDVSAVFIVPITNRFSERPPDAVAGVTSRSRDPNHYDLVFSDKAGNDERSAYVYDTRRVTLGPKIGEIVIVESARDEITLPGISRRFRGFNRNPYIVTFQIEGIDLVLVNAYLYYGKSDTAAQRRAAMEKRQLEAYAVARWCDLRRRSKNRFEAAQVAPFGVGLGGGGSPFPPAGID